MIQKGAFNHQQWWFNVNNPSLLKKTPPFYGSMYVISSPTSIMVSGGCLIFRGKDHQTWWISREKKEKQKRWANVLWCWGFNLWSFNTTQHLTWFYPVTTEISTMGPDNLQETTVYIQIWWGFLSNGPSTSSWIGKSIRGTNFKKDAMYILYCHRVK